MFWRIRRLGLLRRRFNLWRGFWLLWRGFWLLRLFWLLRRGFWLLRWGLRLLRYYNLNTLDGFAAFADKLVSDLMRAAAYYFDHHCVFLLKESLVSYFSCS